MGRWYASVNRLHQLEAIYLKISYFMIDEEKDPECSPAVLQACRWAKSAVSKEYYAIKDRRAGKGLEQPHG